MALRSLLFISFLAALMVTQKAQAQIGLPPGVYFAVRINGTLYCTANGIISPNGAAAPPFSGAQVQFQCGAAGNGFGNFLMTIPVPIIQNFTSNVLADCTLVVPTPLSTCNANLPSVGLLVSALQFVGITQINFLSVADLKPVGFRCLP